MLRLLPLSARVLRRVLSAPRPLRPFAAAPAPVPVAAPSMPETMIWARDEAAEHFADATLAQLNAQGNGAPSTPPPPPPPPTPPWPRPLCPCLFSSSIVAMC